MSGISCQAYPLVGGEISTLYKDLLSILKNRPLANLIYAAYLQPGVAALMNGKPVNKQGQHRAVDVANLFDAFNMKVEATRESSISKAIGAKDSSGDFVDFSDSKQAVEIARKANDNYKGIVSYVTKHGDNFNVRVEARDSRTLFRINETRRQEDIWKELENVFNSIGKDINSFDFNKRLFNATDGENVVRWLNSTPLTLNKHLLRNDIRSLLEFADTTQLARLQTKYGTVDDVADKIYDAYRHPGTVSSADMSLIDSTLDNCKNFNGLNITDLNTKVTDIKDNIILTDEADIEDTLKDLNTKYHIDMKEMTRIGSKITSLSQAATDAIYTLKRRKDRIEKESGVTPEVKALNKQIQALIREISNKRYTSNVMSFLNDALSQIQHMENLFIKASSATGTSMERSIERAKAFMEIKGIQDGYRHIIESLSQLDNILIDESISDTDKQNIKDQAKALKDVFEKYDSKIDELRRDTMVDIISDQLGYTAADGSSIVDLVVMAEMDSRSYDYLYSMSRVSNPLISAMGSIIKDAQEKRRKELVDVSRRIQRAEYELRKAGFDSSFMYEDDGHIISDIDWEAFYKMKAKAKGQAGLLGLKGLELKEYIEAWEEANTEEREVDHVAHRTERVPNHLYRKAFPALEPAQQTYHDTMMKLKGELGTMLPYYAQRQYIPPQKRRSFIDAVKEAFKGNIKKVPKKIYNAIKTKLQDAYKIREDDTEYAGNGIIEGDDVTFGVGDFDNTPIRQIPIFYVNKLKDQEELLKEFSSGMQALAATSINYKCINEIKDLIEFMGDYVKGMEPKVKATDNKTAVEVIEDKAVNMFKYLTKHAKATNTQGIIDGFISSHIYGEKLKDKGKFSKILRTILAFNSSRLLSTNLKGSIANELVGELQMIIEAGGGEFYGFKDLLYAHRKVLGDNTIGAAGNIMDFFTHDTTSMMNLLGERFDPLNDSFQDLQNKRFHKGVIRNIIGKDFKFIGYGIGEHILHFINMYAVLHSIKVEIDGKKARLIDAFYKSDSTSGTSELRLKANTKIRDEEGNLIDVDEAFLDKVKDTIKYVNQTTHGAMNDEDKGLIHQRLIGRFVMNLRQWMVEHYSRRFRGKYWDATLKEWREGYYVTTYKFFRDWIRQVRGVEALGMINRKELNKQQKAALRKALTEHILLGCLLMLSFGLGEPDDHKKEFWYRMFIYQTKRALMEVGSSTPLGLPIEGPALLNSPVAASNTIASLIYPIYGLKDINKTIQKGRHKGENKYWRNIRKYTIPYYDSIEKILIFDEDPSILGGLTKNVIGK